MAGDRVALVTGASSGFGQMIARDLSRAGLTAYASMRDAGGKNAGVVEQNASFAREHDVELRSIDLDVQSEESATRAVDAILQETGRLDIVVHNAGHMVFGPSEAFTAEQFADLYDINVLGSQRVNRAALPHMRARRSGLLVWISSSSVAGGVPPLLGPYFAAKAAFDALAVCYGKELAPFGIWSSIVVPGAFTTGTNHFANAGSPGDAPRAAAYDAAWPPRFADAVRDALAATVPERADPAEVSRAVLDIVESEPAERPYRVVVDPADDGSVVSFAVIDRVRREFMSRLGFPQLLHPPVERHSKD